MAVAPQLALPNVIENGDDFDAIPVEENFVALQNEANTHTHTEYAVKGAITVGDLAFDIGTQAELDVETANRIAALAAHEADTTNIHGIADTAALVLTGDARLTNQRVPVDNSVTSAKIVDGTITVGDLAFSPVISDGSYASAATSVLRARVIADASPRFEILGDGKHQWGDGTLAADTNLYRSAADTLRTDDTVIVGGTNDNTSIGASGGLTVSRTLTTGTAMATRVVGDSVVRLTISADGKLFWGTGALAADATLTRTAAGRMQLDNRLHINSASVGSALSAALTADTNSRFVIQHDGLQAWGPGNAGTDVSLFRAAASILATDSRIRVIRTVVGDLAYTASISGDGNSRLQVMSDGKINWSDGTLAVDTVLYRAAPDVLRSDDRISSMRAIAGDFAFTAHISGDTDNRWRVLANGTVEMGPGNAAVDANLYRAGPALIQSDGEIRAKTGTTAFGAIITGDTSERFNIQGTGAMAWGPGNATQDTSLSRNAAGVLQLGTTTQAGRLLVIGSAVGGILYSGRVTTDSNDRFQVGGDGKITWGPGNAVSDTQMGRGGANTINFGTPTLATLLLVYGGAASALALRTFVTSDVSPRYQVAADGKISWGDGTAAVDANFYRAGPGIVASDSRITGIRPAVANFAFAAQVTGDANARFVIQADGKILWGDGTAAQDTVLYRSAVQTLRTDNNFSVGRNFTALSGVSSGFASIAGNLTDTAAGAVTGMSVTANINPAALSASDFRSLNMSATVLLGNAQDFSQSIEGAYLETRWIGAGNVTGVLIGSLSKVVIPGSAVNFGTIAKTVGVQAAGVQEFATVALTAGTVTTAIGLEVLQPTKSSAGFTVGTAIGIDVGSHSTATTANIGVRIAKGNTYTLQLSDIGGTPAGGITFGVDTNLYRVQADRLATDDLIVASNLGIATKTKAGTPTDADWAVAPPIGTIVIDTTALKIWVRTAAATWKSAALV